MARIWTASDMGRKGGRIGGKRRLVTLTPEERRAIAANAVRRRKWRPVKAGAKTRFKAGMAPVAGPAFPSPRVLLPYARKYIWWKKSEEAMRDPQHVIAQVMNIGDHEDVEALAGRAGDEILRHVIRTARIGQFNARSWTYWHYRLGLAAGDVVPPMPLRFA